MADEQDTIQRRLDNVSDLFKRVLKQGIVNLIIGEPVRRTQQSKKLAQLMATAGIIQKVYGLRITELMESVIENNQTIDGYMIDKAIEGQLAESVERENEKI